MLLIQKDHFSDNISSGAPSLVHEMKTYKLKLLVLNYSVKMACDSETSLKSQIPMRTAVRD